MEQKHKFGLSADSAMVLAVAVIVVAFIAGTRVGPGYADRAEASASPDVLTIALSD